MKEKFKLSDLEIGVYGDSITSFTVVFLLLLIAQKKLKKMFRKKAFIQTIWCHIPSVVYWTYLKD